MPPEYTDFRLTLEGDPTQGYVVTAHGPGDTYARAQVPHALDEVQAVLERIEMGEAPTPGEMQEVGRRLYELLFAGEVGRLFQQTYAVQPAGTHLRLKLHLRTPALARLPWELAYDGQRFLAARLTHPIVRYVESQAPLKLPPLELPLRILYVQASPRDRDALDLDTSEAVLREAVKDWAEVEVIRGAKPADLLKALHQGEGYHILHFDGHGGFDAHRQQGFLLFEDDDGQARTLDGALLADYLAGTPIRLVVLAACHSGKASGEQRCGEVTLTELEAEQAITWYLQRYPQIPFAHPKVDITPDYMQGEGDAILSGLRIHVAVKMRVMLEEGLPVVEILELSLPLPGSIWEAIEREIQVQLRRTELLPVRFSNAKWCAKYA